MSENTSVAKMREKFNNARIMGLPPAPKNLGSLGRSDDPSTSDEPRRGSASQSNEIDHSNSDKFEETTPTVFVASSPIRHIPTGVKKPPVPLPKPILAEPHDHPADAISHEPPVRKLTHGLSNIPFDSIGGKKAQVSPPNTIYRVRNEHVNPTVESSSSSSFSSSSSSSSSTAAMTLAKELTKLSAANQIAMDPHDQTGLYVNDISSSMVSLDEQLPARCMFDDFDSIIDQYRKRDPRTIVFARNKPVMPMMKMNEINILQRLANTHQ